MKKLAYTCLFHLQILCICRIIRSTQSYIFPIHLSEDIIPAAVFYATVTPLLLYFVIKKTIIEPLNADQKQRNIDKTKEVNKARMMERKVEAESAVQLMQRIYHRICNDEEKSNGLLVLSAWYGHFADDFSTPQVADDMGFLENNPNVIDVKIPVQCLVKDGKLLMQAASKVSVISGATWGQKASVFVLKPKFL
jgi:DnaJ homolog subfamily C member 11